MESVFRVVAPPNRCSYLPDQVARMEYELVGSISAAEYMQRMARGWRRFGHTLFRPRCQQCTACRTLRVPVERFRPNRSQRRARQLNEKAIAVEIRKPSVSKAKLELYDRYHAFQTETKGWTEHDPKDAAEYVQGFVDNPFPTEEWCYYLDGRLVGVGYVDVLPEGMSAIYFYYHPDERHRSLGTFNVLCLFDRAAALKLPHLYLGYYVAGCPSLSYKANFKPNQTLDADGNWVDFRS